MSEEILSEDCVPMLMLWLKRHMQEESFIVKGLTLLLRHAESDEGCALIQRNVTVGWLDTVSTDLHPLNSQVILLTIRLLRRLLDCSLTRNIILQSLAPLQLCFKILRSATRNVQQMESTVHCLSMCCWSSLCTREELMRENNYNDIKAVAQKYCANETIVRAVLRFLNWVAPSPPFLCAIFRYGAVGLCLKLISRHPSNLDILRPGVHFLHRSCVATPLSQAYLLRKKALLLVVRSCQLLTNDDEFLLHGLGLVRLLTATREGWTQMEGIPGAWQSLCQGTVNGNALVHDLKGDFANEGWCIGESPFLPFEQQQTIQQTAIEGARAPTRALWTQRTLAEFTNVSTGGFTLAVNQDIEAARFHLLSSLDLLPQINEQREDWYIRLYKYELANDVRIEEMVRTVLNIRSREVVLEAGNSQQNGDMLHQAKPIYIAGKLVTAEGLEREDLILADTQMCRGESS